MKRLLTLILAAMAVQAALAATVKVQIEDLYYNLDTSAKTAVVTYDTSSYPSASEPAYANFSDKNLTIPGTVEYSEEQYTVTSIGSYAFEYCSGLTSVTLPENLTSIGAFAFSDCSGLKEVNIKSLEAWLNIKFDYYSSNPNYYAKNLLINGVELSGKINLPAEWTEVPTAQFAGCKAVTEFILPENITSIGKYAFQDCSSLTTVSLPQSLISMGENAFAKCILLKSVSFPESLTSIGDYAFLSCTGLTSVTFPESPILIGNAFGGCYGLQNVKIKTLEAWMNLKFSQLYSNPNYYAKNLLIDGIELSGTVNLPSEWTEVPLAQFAGCKAVTEFILPENLTSIGGYAFQYCSGLTSVTFPESISSIGTDAFYNCSGLKEVKIKSLEAWLNIRFDWINSNPNNYAKNLLIDGVELAGIVQLPSDLTEVPKYQFIDCKAITEFIFPENLTSIGAASFYGCDGLSTVILPESLSSIGDASFSSCTKLRKVISLNPTPPQNLQSSFTKTTEGSDGILYVPAESLEAYRSVNYWNEFQNIEPIVLAKGLELFAEKNPLTVGHSQLITATVSPGDATVDQFIWSSYDETVATVDACGKVTALKAGTTFISAKTIDGSDIEASIELTVTDSNGNIAIDNFEICIGEIEDVAVNLNLNYNDAKFSAFQFDLAFPEGIKCENVTLGSQFKEAGYELTTRIQDNGSLRVIVTPTQNLDGVDFTQNLVLLNLKADKNASKGIKTLQIINASLSSIDGTDIFLDNSTCSVTLRILLLGDANDNGSVNVADVVTIANFIAKKDLVSWCFVNADVNRDKQITTADITGTVNIISGEAIAPAALARRYARQLADDRLITDNFTPVEGKTFRIGVRLDNTREYSALQASLIIPKGMNVEGVTKGPQAPAHSLIYNMTEESRVEVVVFSTSNKPFSATDGSLFDLEVRATADCGDLVIENILASDSSATDYVLQYEGGRNAGLFTRTYNLEVEDPIIFADQEGISVYNAEGMNICIYAITGEIVTNSLATGNPERFNLNKGIYVVSVDGKTYKLRI